MNHKKYFCPIYSNFIEISYYLFTAPYGYLLQYGHKNFFILSFKLYPTKAPRPFNVASDEGNNKFKCPYAHAEA